MSSLVLAGVSWPVRCTVTCVDSDQQSVITISQITTTAFALSSHASALPNYVVLTLESLGSLCGAHGDPNGVSRHTVLSAAAGSCRVPAVPWGLWAEWMF